MVLSSHMHDGLSMFFAAHPALAPYAPIAFPLILAVALWTIVLKGFSLWYAARGGQTYWFVALLVINTLGILEIVYLIWFRPRSFEIEKAPVHSSSSAV